MKKILWCAWIILSLLLASYYLYTLLIKAEKDALLIGESTYGHYQIELSCESCHTEPFGGKEILQNACLNCHEEELKLAFDSHPKKKFTDPRNADLLKIVDARYCISCHTEHQKEQTLTMGLTIPKDYCFHCHQDIGEERPSHKDLAFDGCADAGCHNFHDNRALYETFLVENADQPWLKEIATMTVANHAKRTATPPEKYFPPSFIDNQPSAPEITEQWQLSKHAAAGVSCGFCHMNQASHDWEEKPGLKQCQTCHKKESEGFMAGKHGMQLTVAPAEQAAIAKISLEKSPLAFVPDVDKVAHSCNSCHEAHNFDRVTAAVTSCLNCHADQHSLAYENSPHGQLWTKAIDGEIPFKNAVSCASCHLPRTSTKEKGSTIVHVEHNQNMNLRPNEKMVRPVCMQCHGLAFAIDALADETLIKNNFDGKPKRHIPSIDWAKKRN